MSSKRGRKRNDNLPPNRARDVQRAFRARRAAHLKALEDRVSELEEENGCLRQALNLPPSIRPPLGKGPTGKDKPKTFDSASNRYDTPSSRESTSVPAAAPSPISRASSESPSAAVSMSSLSSRPMTVIEASSWNDSIVLTDHSSHQNQGQQSQISPAPQQQQHHLHSQTQPPAPTPQSTQPQQQQQQQISHHQHQSTTSSQQTNQGMHHASINSQSEVSYHLAPMSTPLSAPLPMKPHQFSSYTNNFASTSRPLSSTLFSSSSPSYPNTERPMSTSYNNQTYGRTDQLRQGVTNRHQQYSPYNSPFQGQAGNLHSQTPSPGIAHLHHQDNSHNSSNPRDSPLPYPHRRSLTDPQGFSIGQGFPHLPNPTQLQHHSRPPEYIRQTENFHLTTPNRSGMYGPDGRLNIP